MICYVKSPFLSCVHNYLTLLPANFLHLPVPLLTIHSLLSACDPLSSTAWPVSSQQAALLELSLAFAWYKESNQYASPHFWTCWRFRNGVFIARVFEDHGDWHFVQHICIQNHTYECSGYVQTSRNMGWLLDQYSVILVIALSIFYGSFSFSQNGLVATWNAGHRDPYLVQTGDFIFQAERGLHEKFGLWNALCW